MLPKNAGLDSALSNWRQRTGGGSPQQPASAARALGGAQQMRTQQAAVPTQSAAAPAAQNQRAAVAPDGQQQDMRFPPAGGWSREQLQEQRAARQAAPAPMGTPMGMQSGMMRTQQAPMRTQSDASQWARSASGGALAAGMGGRPVPQQAPSRGPLSGMQNLPGMAGAIGGFAQRAFSQGPQQPRQPQSQSQGFAGLYNGQGPQQGSAFNQGFGSPMQEPRYMPAGPSPFQPATPIPRWQGGGRYDEDFGGFGGGGTQGPPPEWYWQSFGGGGW